MKLFLFLHFEKDRTPKSNNDQKGEQGEGVKSPEKNV